MKREQVDEIFDAFMKSAGEQTLEEMYDKYAEDFADTQDLSPQFDEKMLKMFRKEKLKNKRVRHHGHIRRIAAVLIIALGIGGFTVMQVDAWRVKISNFVLSISGGGAIISDSDNKNVMGDSVENWVKIPEYIPEGFEISSNVQMNTKIMMRFTNTYGRSITYEQEIMDSVNYSEFSDESAAKDVDINGAKGQLIQGNNSIEGIRYTKIIWKTEGSVFRIAGQCDEEGLIKMAENVK